MYSGQLNITKNIIEGDLSFQGNTITGNLIRNEVSYSGTVSQQIITIGQLFQNLDELP